MKPSQVFSFVDVLRFVGKPIAYYPQFAKVVGSVNAVIFMCQFLYWNGKQSDSGGWIYKTAEEIREETGLSYKEQKNARKVLKELGILEEKRVGMPARLYYKFNWQKLEELILQKINPEPSKTDNQDCQFLKAKEKKKIENQSNSISKPSKTDNLDYQSADCQFLEVEEGEKIENQSVLVETPQKTDNQVLPFGSNKIDPKGQTNNIHRVLTENTKNNNDDNSFISDSGFFKEEADLLLKLVDWKRYKHPTKNTTTTIRQMIMDIVCINRLRRELFPEEERLVAMVQKDLNKGIITYEQFAQAYQKWELSGVPRLMWFMKALYGEDFDPNEERESIEEIQKKMNEVIEKIRNEKDHKKSIEIYRKEYAPLEEKLKKLKKLKERK